VAGITKNAPFLIFHGKQDILVPIQQAQLMADALHKSGIEATLLTPIDSHLFVKPQNIALWFNESVKFLDKHLKKP